MLILAIAKRAQLLDIEGKENDLPVYPLYLWGLPSELRVGLIKGPEGVPLKNSARVVRKVPEIEEFV